MPVLEARVPRVRLSFHHVGPRVGIQVIRLGGLYPSSKPPCQYKEILFKRISLTSFFFPRPFSLSLTGTLTLLQDEVPDSQARMVKAEEMNVCKFRASLIYIANSILARAT